MIVHKGIDVGDKHYDVVIVGAGISGAILSKVLGDAGKRVLVLEAGTGQALTWEGYLGNLNTFYMAQAKTPESPYPNNPNAPQPDVLDVTKIEPGKPDTKGYFVQEGPKPFESTYARTSGGTTLHWLGTCLRMLPDDFKLETLHHQGRDWPCTYDDLMPYYALGEREIGVSADVENQRYHGIHFEEGYVYPMARMPPSYVDQAIARGIDGMPFEIGGERFSLGVTSTPQGRNGPANPRYDGGKGYVPVGAVGNPDMGQRCAGNTNCTPICPIQAKYNALKTFVKTRDDVTLVTQAVASRVLVDGATGRVSGIEYKAYKSPGSSEHTTHVAKGTIYVLAAHAIENAKLLLASDLPRSPSLDLVGQNLMDHPVLLTWGLMPEKVFGFRGPLSTSGIETMRNGRFRDRMAAFRIEIGNEGWNWPANAPYSDVQDLVDEKNLFGAALRRRLSDTLPRQFRLGFLFEQLPEAGNRVTIDPRYKDQLGNYRPVLQYHISDYIRESMATARQLSEMMFQRLGVEDFTSYSPDDPAYLTYKGQGYAFQGAGHLCGTHLMGFTKADSVVDRRQRSWDFENLYMTGCGNFPTVATSNPTLTLSALAFWAADNILSDLRK